MSTNKPPIERFMEKVAVSESGCWEWTAWVDRHGYGRFSFNDRGWLAHRWSYEFHVGPVPGGLQIDHLCRNRQCVRPDHLEPVTPSVNTRRGDGPALRTAWGLARTHCTRGHEYTRENTYSGGQYRACLTCKRDKNREHYVRNRDLYIERAREWALANPERARELGREAQRRLRAKKAAA